MGLAADVLAVREAVVAVVAAAWPDVSVTTETVESDFGGALAVVRLLGIDFVGESPLRDSAVLEFSVLGRFGRPGTPGTISAARLARGEVLREGLLGLAHPGGVGFGGEVTGMQFVDLGPGEDDWFDLRVGFRCGISVLRVEV